MTKFISAFIRDEEGASAVEYALIAALIAAALVVTVGLLNTGIGTAFDNIITAIT